MHQNGLGANCERVIGVDREVGDGEVFGVSLGDGDDSAASARAGGDDVAGAEFVGVDPAPGERLAFVFMQRKLARRVPFKKILTVDNPEWMIRRRRDCALVGPW